MGDNGQYGIKMDNGNAREGIVDDVDYYFFLDIIIIYY